jgi:hypothetical protein
MIMDGMTHNNYLAAGLRLGAVAVIAAALAGIVTPAARADSDDDRIWSAAAACADDIVHIPGAGLVIDALRGKALDALKDALEQLPPETVKAILGKAECAATIADLGIHPQQVGGDLPPGDPQNKPGYGTPHDYRDPPRVPPNIA